MPKPRVLTKCVANCHTSPNERIIEYSFPGSQARGGYRMGGLICFRLYRKANGRVFPLIQLYRHDKGIQIRKGKAE